MKLLPPLTRCQILSLKCTKFNFGWGSAPDSAGGAYSAPPGPLAGFKGPTSKGREGREGKGAKGVGKEGGGMGGKEKEGREGKGERMWSGPESGLPRGPCWLSAGLTVIAF